MNLKYSDTALLLTWKKLIGIPIAWLVCVILHNVAYGLLRSFFAPNWDEPFFFLLAVLVIPAYTFACGVYTVARLAGRWIGSCRKSMSKH